MSVEGVLVVGETPSLGRAIADLLEAENVPTQYVHDVSADSSLPSLHGRYPVVVVACNATFCATARRWLRGEFPDVELVVVGSRDPILSRANGVHQVPLPLVPSRLLGMVRSLLSPPSSGHEAIAELS